MRLAIQVVELMFFTGLIGCGFVVVISWISIFKEGLSDTSSKSADFH